MSADSAAIAAALRQRGFEIVHGLIPTALLDDLAAELAEQVLPDGEGAPMDRLRAWRSDGDGQLRTAGYHCPAQHKITHCPPLTELMTDLLGGPVWAQPRRFLRLVAPSARPYGTEPHQDYRYVQGAVDTLTAWVPLHRVLADESCLRVVPGSHKKGLWPVTDVTRGTLPHPVGIAIGDGRWRLLHLYPGDAVIFHSLTLHCTTPPRGDQARLSLDVRYQRTDEPIAASGMLAPYECPHSDDPREWAHDPQLDLPNPMTMVLNVPHTKVTVPDGVSRFA